jgi:hypothetical protein
MGMTCEQTKQIKVLQISCRDSDRHLPPQRKAIEEMKKSLAAVGQVTPISVYPITRNTYRVITGATRFRAAAELRWKTISASIWSGSVTDFQLHELVENVERRELTGPQRREMRMKIKQLQAEKLASVEPSKGGRGNKGGVSEAAREEGISRRTAYNRKGETCARTESIAHVSDPPATAPAPAPTTPTMHKTATNLPDDDFRWFQDWCSKHDMNISEGLRHLVQQERTTDQRKEKPPLRVV